MVSFLLFIRLFEFEKKLSILFFILNTTGLQATISGILSSFNEQKQFATKCTSQSHQCCKLSNNLKTKQNQSNLPMADRLLHNPVFQHLQREAREEQRTDETTTRYRETHTQYTAQRALDAQNSLIRNKLKYPRVFNEQMTNSVKGSTIRLSDYAKQVCLYYFSKLIKMRRIKNSKK